MLLCCAKCEREIHHKTPFFNAMLARNHNHCLNQREKKDHKPTFTTRERVLGREEHLQPRALAATDLLCVERSEVLVESVDSDEGRAEAG